MLFGPVWLSLGLTPTDVEGEATAAAEDWDELAAETRLAKKLRRGKISKGEFEQQSMELQGAGDDDGETALPE